MRKKAHFPRCDSIQRRPLKFLINNEYTIRVNYHAPIRGGFPIVGDKRYALTQFHFHRASEEFIHGKQYAMVSHLMHESSDGKLAGIAILLKGGLGQRHKPADSGARADE